MLDNGPIVPSNNNSNMKMAVNLIAFGFKGNQEKKMAEEQ